MIGRRLTLRDVPGVSVSILRHAAALLTRSYQRTVGALAVIRDDDGRVLLVRTAYPPRLWNLPGGRLERGETPGGGLRREVREETGLDVAVGWSTSGRRRSRSCSTAASSVDVRSLEPGRSVPSAG